MKLTPATLHQKSLNMMLNLNLPLDSVAEKDDETKTLMDNLFRLYRHFLENTNLHGCLRTAIRTPFRRVIWTIMLFAVVGWSIYTFRSILMDFYTYPVTSVITIKNDRTLQFPAITVCNVNKLRKSFIPESLKSYADIEHQQTKISDYNLEIDMSELLRRTSIEERKRAWHNISDMLIDCSFNTKRCYESNFSAVESSCYTFNNGPEEILSVTKAGPQYGLVMEINIEQDEYLSLTNTAGVKVIIHDPGEPPFPEDGGILVRPGVETSIGISLTKIDRLPLPYGTCKEEAGNPDDSLYADWHFKYTETGCKKSCYQMSLFKRCNCCDPDLPCNNETILRITHSAPQSIRFCTPEDALCVSNVDDLYLNDLVKCPQDWCPPACDKNQYYTYVSHGAWPADAYFDLFMRKISSRKFHNLTSFTSNPDTFVRKNFLRLEIYYNNLDYTEYVTSPAYNWNKVVGDIGGNMGLWMGFSILAGFEFLELVMDTVIVLVVYCYQKLLNREIDLSSSK